MLQNSTLRPGYLVHVATSITGNTSYARQDIVRDSFTDEGKRFAEWNTQRTVNDPAEQEEAESIRSRASAMVRGYCIASGTFGLSCPKSRKADLDKAALDARDLVAAFNAKARITRIRFFVTTGEIADSDLEAVRQINQEVRDLLERMQDGIRNLDVAKIRDAAKTATQLGQMLSPEAQRRIGEAVDAVRRTARDIVRAGETAALEVDTLALKRIAEARTAFLDLDEAGAIAEPITEGRALDLIPDLAPDTPAEETDSPRSPIAGTPQFALEF